MVKNKHTPSHLNNGTQPVKIQNELSDRRLIEQGGPQGGILALLWDVHEYCEVIQKERFFARKRYCITLRLKFQASWEELLEGTKCKDSDSQQFSFILILSKQILQLLLETSTKVQHLTS